MERILVSACLLGDKVKYDGGDNYLPFLERLAKKYELVPFCPEFEAGLGVPRLKAEIRKGSVYNEKGKDITRLYVSSAEKALNLCKFLGIRIAILKDGSPSCGCRQIYDGSFSGIKVEGLGITAAALINAGIKVYADTDNLEFLLGTSSPIKKEDRRGGKKGKFPPKKRPTRVISEDATSTETPVEEKTFSRKPRAKKDGDRPFERKPRRSFGDKPSFDRKPRGRKPFGERGDDSSFERKPRRSFSDKPMGERKPRGRKPYGDRDSSFERKPRRSFGDKPSFSDKPRGDRKPRRSFGDKPSFDRKPRGRKPFGDKPMGERKPRRSYSDKPVGERKGRGDRSFSRKPRSSSPRKYKKD